MAVKSMVNRLLDRHRTSPPKRALERRVAAPRGQLRSSVHKPKSQPDLGHWLDPIRDQVTVTICLRMFSSAV